MEKRKPRLPSAEKLVWEIMHLGEIRASIIWNLIKAMLREELYRDPRIDIDTPCELAEK